MREETAKVYRSTNGRRYLSRSVAILADCRRLMTDDRHYPTEHPSHSECSSDRYACTPGWHWEESEECKKVFARLLRYAKFVHRKRRTQPTTEKRG